MTHTALIRLGAIATEDVLATEPVRDHNELYRARGMQIIPDGPLAPRVCVNHVKDEPIGRVLALMTVEDAESVVRGRVGGKWLVARVEIDDAPAWLKRGTAASISYAPMWKRDVNGWTVIERGLLREVSVLSPSRCPAEPLARVVHLERKEPKPQAPASEMISYGGPLLIRPGIGEVLGVR